jgi:hypothetical protein
MISHLTPLWWKIQTTTSVGEDVEKPETSCSTTENYNFEGTLKSSLAVTQTFKYTVIVWSNNSTPRYILKRNENVSTQKYVYKCS